MGNATSCVPLSKGPVCKYCGERGHVPLWAMEACQRGHWVVSKEGTSCKSCIVERYRVELENSSSVEASLQQALPAAAPLSVLRQTSTPQALSSMYWSSSNGGGGCNEPPRHSLVRHSMPGGGAAGRGSGQSGREFDHTPLRSSMTLPLPHSPAALQRLSSSSSPARPQLGRHSSGTLLAAYGSADELVAAGLQRPLSQQGQGRWSAHSLVGGDGEQGRGASPAHCGSFAEDSQLAGWLEGYYRKASLSFGGPRRR